MSDVTFFHPPELIEEVKKRPALYKTEQPIDREEKLILWKEIGAAIYPNWHNYNKATAYDRVLKLQRKWRSLRDAYNRELRARRSNLRETRKVYKYFKRMSFLGGFTGTISDEDDPETADSHSNPDGTLVLVEREETPEPPKLRKTKKKHRRRRSTESIPVPEEMELPMFSVETTNESDDTDKLFLLSFLPEMRQLPSNLKMWVRAQIANAMQEAVSCHYNNTQPSTGMLNDKNGQGIKRQRNESDEE